MSASDLKRNERNAGKIYPREKSASRPNVRCTKDLKCEMKLTGRPRIRREDGDSRLSESAPAVASMRKVQVVSNDILRSGDAECFMPILFIGLLSSHRCPASSAKHATAVQKCRHASPSHTICFTWSRLLQSTFHYAYCAMQSHF